MLATKDRRRQEERGKLLFLLFSVADSLCRSIS